MPKTQRLMVVEPFGEYGFGDRITDDAAMKRAIASHPQHVLREMVGDEAPAEAEPSPPASGKKSRPVASE